MTDERLLLKNGTIVDGTGAKAYTGDLLIRAGKIEAVSEGAISADSSVMDCSGKIVSPGFIDMHSHNDWFLPNADRPGFTTPFTEQGITTFVGGNCGFAAAGILPDSPYKTFIEDNNLFQSGTPELEWASLAEYTGLLENRGITHNLATLAGHGTARASIRGWDPSPLSGDEMNQLLGLLEQAMDEGARGVSFGFQYAPGIFSRAEEIKKIAGLVRSKDKLLTVHLKAYSAVSATYPVIPFGKAHNLIALEEAINLAKETGVRLQLSHQIFVGSRTWKTFDRAMALIDRAAAEGVDLMTDTYAYHCGASIITVLLPEWFMAKAPQSYTDKTMNFRVRLLAALSFRLLGFGFEDIQIASANHPALNRFNGMFLSDIARERGVSPFQNYMDFVRESNGTARVLMHRYTSPEIVDALMTHPLSMYMTDAWAEPEGLQNPAVYGCFPRFLQMAREKRHITLEAAVHKMTGASAARFGLKDRGTLEKGKAADITVFDRDTIRDNTTLEQTDRQPSGIDSVFINGIRVVENGKADPALRPGRVLV
ncbi:MAG: amidohydrolase family protein [Desulfobacterales bacterium]|nr:amidohydrolase family protein [Desulfobacterales bacterium]